MLNRSFILAAGATVAAGWIGVTTALADVPTVQVQQGDTLWRISRAHQVSLTGLEMVNPTVRADRLLPGTVLKLPETYTIQPNDTLWRISKRYGFSLDRLERANPGVNPRNLQIGSHLTLPVPSAETVATVHAAAMQPAPSNTANPTDLYWLSRLIYAEANGEPMNAQIAVGDVVYNRAHSTGQGFPNTIKDVIFQVSDGHYQFTCVANGWIYNTPDESSIEAAKAVLVNHENLVPDALVFYNPAKTPAGSWVFDQPTVARIGDFVFAK